MLICADQGINVWELIRLANRPLALIFFSLALAWAVTALLLSVVYRGTEPPAGAAYPYRARVNDHKPFWVIDQVKAAVADSLLLPINAPVN